MATAKKDNRGGARDVPRPAIHTDDEIIEAIALTGSAQKALTLLNYENVSIITKRRGADPILDYKCREAMKQFHLNEAVALKSKLFEHVETKLDQGWEKTKGGAYKTVKGQRVSKLSATDLAKYSRIIKEMSELGHQNMPMFELMLEITMRESQVPNFDPTEFTKETLQRVFTVLNEGKKK